MGYCSGRALRLLLHGADFRGYGEWRARSHPCAGDRPHPCAGRCPVVDVVAHAARVARVTLPKTCRWCATSRGWSVQICSPPHVFRDRALHARRWACVRQSCGAAHLVHVPRLLHGQDRSRGGDARGNGSWLSRLQIRCSMEIDPLCHVGEVLI